MHRAAASIQAPGGPAVGWGSPRRKRRWGAARLCPQLWRRHQPGPVQPLWWPLLSSGSRWLGALRCGAEAGVLRPLAPSRAEETVLSESCFWGWPCRVPSTIPFSPGSWAAAALHAGGICDRAVDTSPRMPWVLIWPPAGPAGRASCPGSGESLSSLSCRPGPPKRFVPGLECRLPTGSGHCRSL